MKTKTLVILSPGFPKDDADDTCLPFLQQFVTQLNLSFPLLKVCILAFDYPFVKATYVWKNNEVIAFNGRKKTKIGRLFKWKSIWSVLKQINQSHSVIGMLSMWAGESAFLGQLFSIRKTVPHYCWILGQDAKPGNKYLGRAKFEASGLIAISDFVQTEFEKNYLLKPLHVIPVGIPEDLSRLAGQKRDIDLLGVGSLITLKQFDVIIEIVRELIERFPQIRVRICGDGPETGDLRNLVLKYSLENNILLTGELSHDQILVTMNRTKIFLHPSLYEGMAAVCLESLAAGCHVISFVRSMQQDIPRWYIVSSREEMLDKIAALLEDLNLHFQSSIPFRVRDSAAKVMQLFHYNEETIS